jgi:hypothetical protein
MSTAWLLSRIVLIGLVAALAVAVATLVPFGYLPGVTTAAEQRAADMGVTIVYTDDERNCGAQLGDGQGGGCFSSETPDVIYVGSWMRSQMLEETILHELGHVWLYQHGLSTHDECRADRLAQEWGAPAPGYYC